MSFFHSIINTSNFGFLNSIYDESLNYLIDWSIKTIKKLNQFNKNLSAKTMNINFESLYQFKDEISISHSM